MTFQFCNNHQGMAGPVILAENLSKATKDKLRSKQSQNYPQGFVAINVSICLIECFYLFNCRQHFLHTGPYQERL